MTEAHRSDAELGLSRGELRATIERLTKQVRLLTLLLGQNHDELLRLRREERRSPEYCAGCPFVELVRSTSTDTASASSEHTPPSNNGHAADAGLGR
jgi:hypothetical protein